MELLHQTANVEIVKVIFSPCLTSVCPEMALGLLVGALRGQILREDLLGGGSVGWRFREETTAWRQSARTMSMVGLARFRDLWFAGRSKRLCSSNLAFTVSSSGVLILAGDQQFAEDVNVAAQNGEPQITLEAQFRVIAATLEAVARLQRANRGFNTRMLLTQIAKRHRGRCHAFFVLLRRTRRNARLVHNLRQFPLVLG